jgi:phage/plasmid-like protein (TIGR03299 family)
MAHMIDTTTGRAAIAYVGQAPWHKLGRQLTAGADIETWRQEAGLGYSVNRSDVFCTAPGDRVIQFPERHVLYRSDTMKPLAVVSKYYQVVQPGQILEFFAELVKHNSFQLETAGVIDEGRRVWALARVNDGQCILDADLIRPYVLLATSYDRSLSTTAKFTSVRVVCHNTLTMAAGHAGQGQSEADVDGGTVRVPHSAKFDAKDVRFDLGIVFDHYERFMVTARRLARQQINETFAASFLKALLPPPAEVKPTKPGEPAPKAPKPVDETKAYKEIMALFNGGAIGSDMPEANGTAFGLLNAVTEYVDHKRGGDDTRLSTAWFGAGDGMKSKALQLLASATS